MFGIGLPSLILAYLAFRGIQNDQALLEQERRQEHYRISESITRSIDEKIRAVELAFFSTIADNTPIQLHLLDSLRQLYPLIEEVFCFQNQEYIHLPTAQLLFLPQGSIQHTPDSTFPRSMAKKIQTAQQYEFQHMNYNNALSGYQRAYENASDRHIKGALLSAMARVQKKSQRVQDALNSYETIAQDFSQVRIAGEIPLGLAARLEISALYLSVNDSLNAVRILTELFSDLIRREWKLEKSQYDFFVQSIRETTQRVFSKLPLTSPLQSYQNNFTVLQEKEKQHREKTEKLLVFQNRTARDLQAKIFQNMDDTDSSAMRLTLESGEHTYLVSLFNQLITDEKQPDGIWGFLINTEYLNYILFPAVLQDHISPDETAWIIRGKNGTAILKSNQTPEGPAILKANFVRNFPPWTIEFYQQKLPVFEAFLTSWRSVYFYMFLLIAGILTFGLIFTIRSVAHELELAKLKSDFVSTISHEFKSPLTSIRQLSEMLKTDRVPSKERRFKYYDILVEQSERLSLLIDNILDFSKMEEGRKEFVFGKTNIHEVLQEIVSTTQDRVRHEGFMIQVKIGDSLPFIKLDRTAVSQAINNLIDNAIKYSAEVKQVVVSAYAENQYLVISIQDFGIGIRKEEINKIFERFYRGGDELTRTVKGSGLGLTLVKQIVEAHHGKVDVKSEPGKGSVFKLFLPLDASE